MKISFERSVFMPGTSLAITIPDDIVTSLKIQKGDIAVWTLDDNDLVIKFKKQNNERESENVREIPEQKS